MFSFSVVKTRYQIVIRCYYSRERDVYERLEFIQSCLVAMNKTSFF